jgi:hypothetical protein
MINSKMKWAVNVGGIEEKKTACEILVRKHGGERLLGRPED